MTQANVGSIQRKRLSRKVSRNRRRQLPRRIEPSKRSQDKSELHEKYLDQVALDKLNGLESGRISRKAYRDAKPQPKPKVQSRGKGPRSPDTYRGARRNAERGTRRALVLKADRLKTGETRRGADRRRYLARAV